MIAAMSGRPLLLCLIVAGTGCQGTTSLAGGDSTTRATESQPSAASSPIEVAKGEPTRVEVRSAGRLRVEIYRDAAAFRERLLGAVRTITFDDIESDVETPTAFADDRYAKSHGVTIRGAEGQFVDRTFTFPEDFTPVSAPNMYAPGPTRKKPPEYPKGGCTTAVTFTVRDRRATVPGFGLWFLDADNSHIAKCRLTIRGVGGRLLCTEESITTKQGGHTFVGLLSVDRSGRPVAAIESVEIVNGDEFPSIDDHGDGVALDDFVFGIPVAAPRAPR